MGAGKLTERVAFDKPVGPPDGGGGTLTGWAEQFTCRAGYTRLRGGESVMASRLDGRQPTVIRVRASSDTRQAGTDWRVRDMRTDDEFNIRSIIETGDRLYLDITAESGVAV